MNDKILTEEESILQAAQIKYDAQDGANQRHIPLELFITEERERRQPGYKKPLSIEESIKLVQLVQKSESKNIFISSIAKIQLARIRYYNRSK